MAQEYLPAPSNVRLADLMKEHNISQPELAKEIGCSKSTINRFISGAKGTLTHEQVLRIARLFNVSTDFLLGETNIPDRKNYDIAELGLSVEAAKNLYTGRVNTEVCCLAQQVLAGLAAADSGVVGSSAVAAGDMHRLSEVLPDALQQHHQLVVDEDDVAALAAELPHPEAGRELPGGVPGQGIFFDSDREHDLSF